MVGEICRDLEKRCQNAERPYRDEQLKCSGLQMRLEAALAEAARLESQLHIRMVESEAIATERDELRTKLDQQDQDFERAKSDTARAIQDAAEIARNQDLAYLAIIAGKEQDFEEQAQKLTSSKRQVADQDQHIAQLKSQSLEDAKIMSDNKTMISNLNSAVAVANDLASSRQSEVTRLIASETALMASTEELATRLQETTGNNDLLISKLNVELQTARYETSELQQRYEKCVSDKDAGFLRLENAHQCAIQKWRMDLDEARLNASVKEEQSTSRIKRLRKELEEQSSKLAKTQKNLDKFIAVHVEMAKSEETSTGEHSRRQSPLTENDAPIWQSSNERIRSPFDSSTSPRIGPRAKRNKIHPSPQTPSKSLSKSVIRSTTTNPNRRSSMRVRRSPLNELHLTQNHAHFTPPQHLSKKGLIPPEDDGGGVYHEDGTDRGLDSDEEFFDGIAIITSTDHQLLSASHKRLPKSNDEDTTMDESTQGEGIFREDSCVG
ncbi:hypothetical protein P7C71_g3943, partial [Lecanoromycetidae sp. Uapishka_2]